MLPVIQCDEKQNFYALVDILRVFWAVHEDCVKVEKLDVVSW